MYLLVNYMLLKEKEAIHSTYKMLTLGSFDNNVNMSVIVTVRSHTISNDEGFFSFFFLLFVGFFFFRFFFWEEGGSIVEEREVAFIIIGLITFL